jgi:hypothetical protein
LDWYDPLLTWPALALYSVLGGAAAARLFPKENRCLFASFLAVLILLGFALLAAAYHHYRMWTWF